MLPRLKIDSHYYDDAIRRAAEAFGAEPLFGFRFDLDRDNVPCAGYGCADAEKVCVCRGEEVMTAEIAALDLMHPEDREYLFENRLHLPTLVHYENDITVELKAFVTDEWLKGLFSLNGTSDPTLRRIVPKMYAAIPKRTIVASIELDGRIVATGLAICDREWAGIYAIYVTPSCWKRGYARAVCSTLLKEAAELGAVKAYLQVVQGNIRAKRLYQSMGFEDFYTYWFRSFRGTI